MRASKTENEFTNRRSIAISSINERIITDKTPEIIRIAAIIKLHFCINYFCGYLLWAQIFFCGETSSFAANFVFAFRKIADDNQKMHKTLSFKLSRKIIDTR